MKSSQNMESDPADTWPMPVFNYLHICCGGGGGGGSVGSPIRCRVKLD